MYETPTITELGSVADFTRAVGIGPGSDASFPWAPQPVEDFLTHSTS